jgi:hypothetical protein
VQREAFHEFVASTGGSQAGEQGSERSKSIEKIIGSTTVVDAQLQQRRPQAARDVIDKIR